MQLGAAMFAAAFSMEAFTPWGGRRIRVMGTRGFIEGDEKGFAVYDFCTGKKRVWAKKVSEIAEYKGAGHADGDFALMRDFLRAVDTRNPAKLTSSIEESIESHFMGFACEESRLKGVKADVGNCLGF